MPKIQFNILVVIAALTSGVAALASASKLADIAWDSHVVGTPYLDGGARMTDPKFVAPTQVSGRRPDQVPCDMLSAIGEFEAYVTSTGVVESVTSHREPVTGTKCQRTYIFSAIKHWRFDPARFEGAPTPVYLWIQVRSK